MGGGWEEVGRKNAVLSFAPVKFVKVRIPLPHYPHACAICKLHLIECFPCTQLRFLECNFRWRSFLKFTASIGF
jgi:hypothetical protein